MNTDNSIVLDIVISYIGPPAAVHSSRDIYAWKCPFHKEKTPSFYLYLNHGGGASYFCYGCHMQGRSWDFTKKMRSRGLLSLPLDRTWSTHYEIEHGLRYDGRPVGSAPALPSITTMVGQSGYAQRRRRNHLEYLREIRRGKKR